MKTPTEIPLMEGLTQTTEIAKVNKGHLAPPPQFDDVKFVGKWVKQGPAVVQAGQPQFLEGNFKVAGWQVWKHQGKPCVRGLSSGLFILMYRPKELQNAVSAICGNISRAKIMREQNGESVAGDQNSDRGILTPDRLALLESPGQPLEPEQIYAFNKIPKLTEAHASKATTRPKQTR